MQEKLPLVSILIPAYNQVQHLENALISALNQTYTNIEIIICDDSTTDDVEKLINHYLQKYKNIKYYSNGGPLGQKGVLNMQKCFDLSSGEYINYLMHDDLFSLNKIKLMLKYLVNNKDATLVTSHKRFINENNQCLCDTKPFMDKTCKIDGQNLGLFMLNNMINVVGEPTTAMFRKSDIEDKILSYEGRTIRGFGDMAIWLKLLTKGHAIYIKEPLSYFRIHGKQNTYDPIIQLWGIVDWYHLITNSYLNNNFIKSRDQYLNVIKKWLNTYKPKIKFIKEHLSEDDEEEKELRENLNYCYIQAIKTLLNL